MSLSPELSVYTYNMLGQGLNRSMLPHLTNDMMRTVCGINNPIHRLKLRQALQGRYSPVGRHFQYRIINTCVSFRQQAHRRHRGGDSKQANRCVHQLSSQHGQPAGQPDQGATTASRVQGRQQPLDSCVMKAVSGIHRRRQALRRQIRLSSAKEHSSRKALHSCADPTLT